MVCLVGTCSLTISLNYVNVNYKLSHVLLKKIEIAGKGVFRHGPFLSYLIIHSLPPHTPWTVRSTGYLYYNVNVPALLNLLWETQWPGG